MYLVDLFVHITFWITNSIFFQSFFRFYKEFNFQLPVSITLPIEETQLDEIHYFITTFEKMSTLEQEHNVSIFTYMMRSGEIQVDTLIFLITYFNIPLLHQQMLNHLTNEQHILNYQICKAIFTYYGIDSLESLQTFRRLKYSTSIPNKIRNMSITTFAQTDNTQLHNRIQQYFTQGHQRQRRYQFLSKLLCKFCSKHSIAAVQTPCCKLRYHPTCGTSYRTFNNTRVCTFCFTHLTLPDIALIHASHQLPHIQRYKQILLERKRRKLSNRHHQVW